MHAESGSIQEVIGKTREEVAKVIIGHQPVVDAALIAILTNNHALIEGVPGVAKTLLVRTLAKVLGCEFGRIQFTPDLMPADITGTNIYNVRDNSFQLVKGPIFTTFLLADEINRAPAKTQSALLESMQERTVTIDRETFTLSPDFTVFATQNPIEYEGTYPLPEAQKDRFMLKIHVPYPEKDDELSLAKRLLDQHSPEQSLLASIEPVLTAGALSDVRQQLVSITIREELVEYLVNIIRATRSHESVLVGAGPRATQALLQASRVRAVIDDRDFVTPDDIKEMTASVIGHRIVLRPEFEIEGLTLDEVTSQVLESVPVPR